MSEVEHVATWVGLVFGIAGIVLSVVTIWFALMTDRSNRQVTDQTIRSLQKIESAVERTSTDTQGLIKVAWERMLGEQRASEVSSPLPTSAQVVTSGLAAELRNEIAAAETQDPGVETQAAHLSQIRGLLDRFDDLLKMQFSSGLLSSNSDVTMDTALRLLRSLSPEAFEFLRAVIAYGHLTREEYIAIRSHDLGRRLLSELRDRGLITPLKGHGPDRDNVVYWLPPGVSKVLRPAMVLVGRIDEAASEQVASVLYDAKITVPARQVGKNDLPRARKELLH